MTSGAIYLGGQSVTAMARAGRIHGEPAALTRADGMFHWPTQPWCPEVF